MSRVHKWAIAAVLLVGLTVGVAYAGVQSRAIKAGGSTDYATGQTITAAEVNTDFNTLYTLQDGNIDTDNLDSAAGIVSGQIANDTLLNVDVNSVAAIVYSKLAQTASAQDMDIVDDYSTDAAEQATESDPQTSDDPTALALHLETEIAQLRYKIHELTVGTSASAVAAAGGTAALTSWIDGPIRGSNLIFNGNFDMVNTLATGANGDGWVRTHTPTTLEVIALVETEGQGDGNAIRIIDTGDDDSGIKQTLNGLKAATKYLLIGVIQDDVGTCKLTTTGADTNDLTLTSDDGGGWQILSGTFETDGTPTDVVVSLLAVDKTGPDDCSFLGIGVYAINTDPVPRSGIVVDTDSCNTANATFDNAAAWEQVDCVRTITATPPGPGYYIKVTAHGTFEVSAAAWCALRIAENGTTKAIGRTYLTPINATGNVALVYVNKAPTPGTDYAYTLDGQSSSATRCGSTDAYHEFGIVVEMIPSG